MKPKLLLDIDGVLNPYDAKPTQRPDGYITRRYERTAAGGRWGTKGLRVWLNPSHGPMLLALDGLVELVWATAWEHEANTLVAPEVGLPQLPVIEFPYRASYEFGHIFKLGDVKKYVGEGPFAWLDDDFEKADLEWAKERSASGIPTLFVNIDPAIGLRQEDVNWIADWAAR